MLNAMYVGERTKTLSSYKKWKIKMLKKDFCIKLSPDEEKHINNLKTEMEIDRYIHTLLNKAWN